MQIFAKLFLLSFLLGWTPLAALGQSQPGPLDKITPIFGIQLWGSYNHGASLYDSVNGYQAVDNRLSFILRRTRLGLSVQASPRLQFKVLTAIDNVGRDVLASQTSGTNNGSFPQVSLWEASAQWKISPNTEAFYLTAGYFVPHLGRESFTGGLAVTSIEKSWTQNYLRRHLTGTGPGRATGVNLGGQLGGAPLTFSYNLGVFTPTYLAYSGNSAGLQSAAVWVGHGVLHLGDPEKPTYSRGHKITYLGQRKGLSLGFGGAAQGQTDRFTGSYTLAVDALLNWKRFNLDGEWIWMSRTGTEIVADGSLHAFQVAEQTAHIRMSYLFQLPQEHLLEPVLHGMFFQGSMTAAKQELARQVGMFAGKDVLLEVGLNWYPIPRLKVNLAYTGRAGKLGEASPGTLLNNYFAQGSIPIQRGNWLGIGLVYQL